MKVNISHGKYIVAVSGGVDSMVLLDLLSQQSGVDLIVAHFDHGMRNDSANDCEFVANYCKANNIKFVSERAELGGKASEEIARHARYHFLRNCLKNNQAKAIITAHHQDDAVETTIFNLLRGTGSHGASSLQSSEEMLRPLLGFNKQQIINYAKKHKLDWREDSTNKDIAYTRNWIRLKLVPKLSNEQKDQLLRKREELNNLNSLSLKILYSSLINGDNKQLSRQALSSMPHIVLKNILVSWLRLNNLQNYDKKIIERISVGIKVLKPGKQMPITSDRKILIGTDRITLE